MVDPWVPTASLSPGPWFRILPPRASDLTGRLGSAVHLRRLLLRQPEVRPGELLPGCPRNYLHFDSAGGGGVPQRAQPQRAEGRGIEGSRPAQFPVGFTELRSTIRMAALSGALVRCITPFGMAYPWWCSRVMT